ncbi:hypothetical protein H8K26_16675 [Undibacterium aquatile]|uniref:XRE family transcriptional regulator n=2 Tax=Undibacterium aquatile TaxID=1537398 RepID=A0ABR6XJK5_9BURK|nr:hypothetical protein [Undibacterium aquatile]
MNTKKRRNWNALQASNLRQALEWCKEYARSRHNRSIERIAELMGLADHWSLYKWLENGRMPAVLIRSYEAACGIDYVTRWLAASSGKMLITIPSGRQLQDADVIGLHSGFASALELLTQFYAGKADVAATSEALTNHLQQVAFHHANVQKHGAPEFNFGEESHD